MFRDKHFEVRVQKDPPSLEKQLREPMSLEEKIEIVERLGTFALLCYATKVAVDAAGTIAVHAALKVMS